MGRPGHLFWVPSWFIDFDHNGTTFHDSNSTIGFRNKFWSRIGSGAGQWARQWRLQWAIYPFTWCPSGCPADHTSVAATRSPRSGHRTPWRHTTPCRFQPKYILESPKSPITQTRITQSFQSRFQILSMKNMALCLSYSTQFDSRLRRLPERSYQIVCTPGSPPLTHLVSAIPNFGTIIWQVWYYSKTFIRAIVCGVTSALSMGLITTKLSAKYNGNCCPSLWHLPQYLQCPVMTFTG
jgi:hypothetical protein